MSAAPTAPGPAYEAGAPRQRQALKDTTHYGKSWEASCKLLDAEARLAVTPPGRRAKLNRTIRNKSARLERLTAREREMTCLLAPYLDQHDGKMRSYQHFIDWCVKRGKLTEPELRTIQYRLQNQYGARGEPGKPGRPPKTKT